MSIAAHHGHPALEVLAAAHVPPEVMATFARPLASTPATRGAQAFVAAPIERFLVLAGGPGSGKTTGGAAVLAAGRPGGGIHVTALELFRYETARRDTEGRAVVLVDDLGEDPAFWISWQRQLAEILAARDRPGLRTVVTTRLEQRTLELHYPRLAELVRRRGRIVDAGDVDLRRGAAARARAPHLRLASVGDGRPSLSAEAGR